MTQYPALTDSTTHRPVRARLAVVCLFTVVGMVLGSWAGRIPSVHAQVGLSDAQWGLVLLAAPIGSLVTLALVPRLVTRVGARTLTRVGAAAVLVAVPVAATSTVASMLAATLLVQGMAATLVSTSLNALAVIVERGYGRRIMSSFHASFSLGQLTGGLASATAAALGVAPGIQIAAVNVLLGGAVLATTRSLPDDRPSTQPAGLAPAQTAPRTVAKTSRRRLATVSPQLLLLAAIALLSSINEGAAVQWSAQYGAVTLAAGAGLGAVVFSCFSISMTASRFVGDRIVDRLGPARFVRVSALVAASGMVLALSVGSLWAAFAGFALLGIGSACMVPTLMSLAGNQPGISPAQGVATVSRGQWPAFLLGPPLIGVLAGMVGLRLALGLVIVSTLAIALLAGRVRPARAAVDGAIVASERATTDPSTDTATTESGCDAGTPRRSRTSVLPRVLDRSRPTRTGTAGRRDRRVASAGRPHRQPAAEPVD